MEKEHMDPQESGWFDGLLGGSEPVAEIEADELAVVGLTRPEDLEIEKIINEVQEDDSAKATPGAEFSLEASLPENALLCGSNAEPAEEVILSEPALDEKIAQLAVNSENSTAANDSTLDDLIAEFSENEPISEGIVPAAPIVEIPMPDISADVAPQTAEEVDAPAEEVPQEIEADEMAMHSAGLTHPKDVEIEKIISEMREDVPEISAEAEAEAEEIAMQEDLQVQEQLVPEVPVEEPQEKPKRRRSVEQKRRPKWKKGYGLLGIPHIISTGIWLAIILFIGITLGRMLWVCCADLMAFGKEANEVTITIEENENIESISKKLGDAGLIRYPGLFKLFAELTGKDDNITFGTYTLNSIYDYNAMINAMSSTKSRREVVTIMFPDGYNCAQIFALLEEKGVCTVEDLENYAATGELDDYWFLEGVTRGSKYCLEGYLAPDTYTFYTNDEPGRVLEKFLNEFDDRFTDLMKEDFAEMQTRYANMLSAHGYGADYIEHHKLTLHKLITLASIVEKETSSSKESYDIASVFYNRLANPTFPYLGSDATVYYAIGDYFFEKEELTSSDLSNTSPYNTRNHEGLPPGAICNPGIYSLYAVLDPNDTSYYYFVFDASIGEHLFSKTYDEHLKKVNSLGL